VVPGSGLSADRAGPVAPVGRKRGGRWVQAPSAPGAAAADVPTDAVWLLPTPEFRRAAFDHRATLWTIADTTTDPERALRNLLERDRLCTERLAAETTAMGLPAITVDTTMSEDELFDQVTEALGL
jgi:hypothetical protein